MNALETFLRLVQSYPWPCFWLCAFVLFVLAIISRMRLGGVALAIVALVVVLAVAPWRREKLTVVSPAPIQAEQMQPQPPMEQAEPQQTPESRPSPYGEQDLVQEGLR